MGEVIFGNFDTSLDVPAERILDGAKEADLDVVFVLGFDAEGGTYFAGSTSDVGMALVLFEKFKRQVIE
jgi:hypothetical protein